MHCRSWACFAKPSFRFLRALASMVSLRHCQGGHLNKGLLPPLRELFLEIQVNKLINEYLLSSTAEETACLHHNGNGISECKENIAMSVLSLDSQSAMLNACNAPWRKSTGPFHDALHGLQHQQNYIKALDGPQPCKVHSLHLGGWSTDLKNTKVEEQMASYGAQGTFLGANSPDSPCYVSSGATLSIQNAGGKTPSFHRDTFPGTNGELRLGGPCKVDTEMKVSAKKPPLPPKLPNKPNLGLTKCFSEMGTLPQSTRRAKSEKKRSSSSTSVWALLFTLCFAVIMISQGFLSQGSQGIEISSTNTSSLAKELMKTSRSVAAQEKVAADGKNPLRVKKVKGEVQAEHLSHLKHLDFGT